MITEEQLKSLDKKQLIELRETCNRLINAKCGLHPESKEKKRFQGSLFNEAYYIQKVLDGDYSSAQLLTIRKNARARQWTKLLCLLDQRQKENIPEAELERVLDKKVDATGFFAMLESL